MIHYDPIDGLATVKNLAVLKPMVGRFGQLSVVYLLNNVLLPEDYMAMVAGLSSRRRGFDSLLGDQI